MTVIPSEDGSHNHSQYAGGHEISELREEFDNKVAALEMKILGILSLFKQLYSTSSGICRCIAAYNTVGAQLFVLYRKHN